jgi:alanyl-tRNA synthetase
MNINDVRTKYLEFFAARGHVIVPSASIVPQNDPTTLFTGSGMQPILPYLLGEPHPAGSRITDSQKSFRAEDIDEVGDNRHTTFFEMLGNWSFGDYFKTEQLPWIFAFLTDEIGLDPQKLYVTVFIGDEKNNLPRDTESVAIWKGLFAAKGIEAKDIEIGSEADGYEKGMQGGRIFYYDARKNWWSRAGTPEKMPAGEPGGPDSEIFYDFGGEHDTKWGAECHPNCDCGRFMEICNSVFMQYLKQPDGSFGLLPKQNVDFGGGLERIAAASNADPDVFKTDVFWDIILQLENFSGKKYDDIVHRKSFRIVADHMRAATIMLGDGVRPSNTERGYVLRRLIRRASQHAQKLGLAAEKAEDSMLVRATTLTIEKYKHAYPELDGAQAYEDIVEAIWKEEVQFARTLVQGLKEFERLASGAISAEQGYMLFTTYGFPFEMTEELAQERGIDVDKAGFKDLMKKHSELSRAGSEQKFKGGLADTSEKTTRLHTAHHLLLRALQIVLGAGVKQRGSNITQERLRIDFSYPQKMTQEQIAAVEKIVNEKIAEEIPMTRITVPKEVAEKSGAEQEFGAKYPDQVSVYVVGPVLEDPETMLASAFSKEFCGGPHVSNTKELAGTFKIQKEEAVASGVRRIKAVLA